MKTNINLNLGLSFLMSLGLFMVSLQPSFDALTPFQVVVIYLLIFIGLQSQDVLEKLK